MACKILCRTYFVERVARLDAEEDQGYQKGEESHNQPRQPLHVVPKTYIYTRFKIAAPSQRPMQ